MTPELYEAVAKIARHCWRGVHWEKGPNGPRPVREPLKRQHLERHVNGGPGVGLAPIAPGEDSTRVAVLDFDSHKGEVLWQQMRAIAVAVADTLRGQGLEPIAFRSSGGKGIHLIMLWDEPQDAYSVRELLVSSLSACGLENGTKGVKHQQVEVFPKQDSVPSDGLGNMFVLPLTGESLPLDPAALELKSYEYAEQMREWPKSQPVQKLERPSITEQKPSTIDPASLPTSLAEVRSALAAIPNEGNASLDYDSWRDVIFAVHHATDGSAEGLFVAQEFSARSSKHDPDFLTERVWPYIRSDRGGKTITVATLFNRARQHGWADDVINSFEDLGPIDSVIDAPVQQSTNESPSKPARFVVQPLHVFAQRPSPTWIVKRILPRAEVALIIGESGAGKSFVAFDLAAAIVRGVDWRQEFHTAKGQVVYVVAEGASFFHQRAVAYARHHDLSLDALQMGVVSDTPNLLLKEDVKSLAQQLKAFGKTDVVIIDTFAQVTPGGNENSGEDMGRALAHCKTLHRATGAVVLLVHHIGKDESKGARGWSGIKAAADAELTIARRDPMRTITVSKMKDGPDGLVLPFKLVDVEIDKDEEGEAIKSCIVHHLEEAQDARPVRQPQGVNACAVWEAVQNLTALDPNTTVDDVITMAAAEIIHDPKKKHDRRREMARQALVGLQTLGYVDVSNGIVTMAGKE